MEQVSKVKPPTDFGLLFFADEDDVTVINHLFVKDLQPALGGGV
jgi:hypothetical protein